MSSSPAWVLGAWVDMMVTAVTACMTAYLGGHDGAERDPRRDHQHGGVLGGGVALAQQRDPHQHVGDQTPRPEYHVQGHRNVEI